MELILIIYLTSNKINKQYILDGINEFEDIEENTVEFRYIESEDDIKKELIELNDKKYYSFYVVINEEYRIKIKNKTSDFNNAYEYQESLEILSYNIGSMEHGIYHRGHINGEDGKNTINVYIPENYKLEYDRRVDDLIDIIKIKNKDEMFLEELNYNHMLFDYIYIDDETTELYDISKSRYSYKTYDKERSLYDIIINDTDL